MLHHTPVPALTLPRLAPYAADAGRSRGRRFAEAPSALRTPFQRDRDRIIHSAAFRRLAQKTQVFLPTEGDHFRTRLTHTIEVSQITRTLTRALGLDDDLGEALALAHDLGHTPFGHTGEDALSDVLEAFGGFDHNAQTLRIVTFLERRYSRFDGLNLTWETLEGLLKRGGRRPGIGSTENGWHHSGLVCLTGRDEWVRALDDYPSPSAEAQAAALADDIAYNAHDLEDGLAAALFGLDDLDEVPFLAEVKNAILAADPDLAPDLLMRGLARELVGRFVEDAVAESRRRLDAVAPLTADDVRRSPQPLLALSPAMLAASETVKRFLFNRMYRHPRLVETRAEAKKVVRELADALLEDPRLLPAEWRCRQADPEPGSHARRVADYIAGMTDRFAFAEHARLFDGAGVLS